MTPILLSLNIRTGSRRERQRRTVADRRQKRSLLAIEGIPVGGGKPKKACTHAIIAGPPLGSQIVSSHQQVCIQQSANKTRQDRCGYKLVAASYWLLAKAEETTLPGIWYLVIGSGRKPKAKATTRASSCWLLAASKSTEPRFLGIWYLVIGQKPKPKAKPRRRGLLCPCKPKSGCNGKPHSRGCLYPCKPKPGLHGGPRCATYAIWAQNQKSAGHRRCREAFNGANRD